MAILKAAGARALRVLPVLFIVTLAVTAMVDLMPGSPAATILGTNATPEQVKIIDERYGFSEPLFQRYFSWMGGVLTGDFGESILTGRSVMADIAQRLPVTFQLAICGLVVAVLIAVPLAVACAARPQGRLDTLMNSVSSALLSVPPFVGAVVLVFVFSVSLGWLPVTGFVPITEDPVANLTHIALPVLTLAIPEIGYYYRILRADLATTLQEDFVLSARAKGLTPTYTMFRHVLRPSLFSTITMIGLSLGRLLSGSIIVEYFFAIPGLGALAMGAIPSQDIPVIQAFVFVVAVIYVLINALIDVTYSVIDPRVKVS